MDSTPSLPLEPLPYHEAMIRHLQAREAELWDWFSRDRIREDQNEAVRLDLLKSTYRIERESNPALYGAGDEVATALGLPAPSVFYQAPDAGGLNAALAYLPGEVHLILSGKVTEALTPVELRCVLAHELLHFALLDRWREYLTAEQILGAMVTDEQATAAHVTSHRLFHLYTEVYCDRGAYRIREDLAAAVASLVKLETGSTDISGESYLRQAAEVFAKGRPRSEGLSHPETYIRARALQLWVEQPDVAASEIDAVISGPPSLAELGLLDQERVMARTRRLIRAFLRPAWLHTERLEAQARLFFDDFEFEGDAPDGAPRADDALAAELRDGDDPTQDYYGYVLLDFAVADRDLAEAPLAAALLFADDLGLGERFRALATKELKLRKRQWTALEDTAEQIVAKASESEAEV
jgi:hypothetical protein